MQRLFGEGKGPAPRIVPGGLQRQRPRCFPSRFPAAAGMGKGLRQSLRLLSAPAALLYLPVTGLSPLVRA